MAQRLLAINIRNFIIIVLVHHSQKMYWLLNFLRNRYGECKIMMAFLVAVKHNSKVGVSEENTNKE